MRRTIVRAKMKADGSIEHLLPPELHDDPLSKEGVLAFYNFGFDILDLTRQAGFVDAKLVVWYEPPLGFTSNNHPEQTTADGSFFGNMHPCAVVARKPTLADKFARALGRKTRPTREREVARVGTPQAEEPA